MKSRFADSFNAELAARIAVEHFGDGAEDAVASCAFDAWIDGRQDDYRFWFDVFDRLTGLPSTNRLH